jgi:arsenate reductase
MKKILILCTGNSCRSQMAEGYLRFFASTNAAIYSAGIETHGVNPRAIAAMKEDNIDISNHTSNNVNEYINIDFDVIITVCDNAKERCPYFPSNAKRFHQAFPDPYNFVGSEQETIEEFKRVRDLIKVYCKKLTAELLQLFFLH